MLISFDVNITTMKKSVVYTRTGDDGTTSLVGGVRVAKTHIRLEAYGTIDELNANIGMLVSLIDDSKQIEMLRYVQNKLFSVGAYLATDQSVTAIHEGGCIHNDAVERLEQAIDEIDSTLPQVHRFVLPGGSYPASVCHVCRTICRRAERRILGLEEQENIVISPEVKRFINRLSDYLFVLSRNLNILTDSNEFFWDKSC